MKSLVYLFWAVCFVVLTVPAFATHGRVVRQRIVVRPQRVQKIVVQEVQQVQQVYVPAQQVQRFYAPVQQFNAGCHNGQQQFNAGQGCSALYSR